MEKQPTSIPSSVSLPRISRIQGIAALAIVGLFAVFPLLTPSGMFAISVAITVFVLIGWALRSRIVLSLGSFCLVCIAFALAGLPSQLWILLGLIAYWGVLWFGFAQAKPDWLKAGTFSRSVFWWMAASIVASAIALSVWFLALRPNIGDITARFLPNWPLPALILGGLAFSMVNAAIEEMAYRGVLTEALKDVAGPKLAVLGQAAAFGLLHIHGFPRGWVGVVLAFIFGMLMAIVRLQSGGILAPWIAHVCADIVIVALVIGYASA